MTTAAFRRVSVSFLFPADGAAEDCEDDDEDDEDQGTESDAQDLKSMESTWKEQKHHLL